MAKLIQIFGMLDAAKALEGGKRRPSSRREESPRSSLALQINARVYAESFRSQAHLDTIVVQAQEIVGRALAG